MRILIIEDEKRLAETLADLLACSGYETETARNGQKGLDLARSGVYDAIVLDVMLPELNGFQVLEHLRKDQILTPVLMLTAKSSLEDRVRGLDTGADYYLAKPFDNRELLACLRAILRRENKVNVESLHFGDLELNVSISQLRCGERSVMLSAKELALLEYLIQNSGQYLTKERILQKIWGYDADVGVNSVEAYVSFLRKKFALLQSKVRLTVVRNIGYKLELEV